MKFTCLSGLAALTFASAADAQPVTPEQLMPHIRVLADDSYEGRASGTAGGERTEAYILEAFARAGLKPGMETGWRQNIRVVRRTPDRDSLTFTGGGRTVRIADSQAALVSREPTATIADAPVIFVGHGTDAQLAGTDVRGAVLLMIPDEPPNAGGPDWQDRRIALAEAGAAAVVTINPASSDWAAVPPESRKSVSSEGRPFAIVQGPISHAAALEVLAAAGDSKALLEWADRPDFRARRLPLTASAEVHSYIEEFTTANIVGMVQGSHKPDEAVVLMGHWDHVGHCAPEGAADRICNGAVDNASGIAVMIEAAEAIAAGPRPERSVYFVATTYEEGGGFLGATTFATESPPQVDRIVAVLNVDTIAIHPRGLPVAIIGRGRFPELDRVIDATARALGRGIDTDDEANVMIERQDGWAFTKRGIPSVMASGSFSDMADLQAFLNSSYHQPNDDLNQKIELGGAAEDADLHIALVRALADPDVYPSPE